ILKLLDLLESLLQVGPCLVLLGHVHVGSNQFHDLPGDVEYGMADAMDVPDRPVRADYTEVDFTTCLMVDSAVPGCIESGHILWVDPAVSLPVRDGLVWIESEYAVGLWGPIDYLRILHVVRPATGVAEGLSFCQISLAPPQAVFRLLSIFHVR